MAEQFIPQLFSLMNILGLTVFAISGALFAAEKNMDILGLILIGTITGIGGGTLRDLLLGISPVSWVQEPFAIYLCISASIITYFTAHSQEKRIHVILWMDAMGLCAFAVLGTEIALSVQDNPIIAMAMGVMSATFGGVMRDVLCAKTLTLMRPELYISCALASAATYVILEAFQLGQTLTQISAFAVGFGLRASAILFKLEIPRFGYERS